MKRVDTIRQELQEYVRMAFFDRPRGGYRIVCDECFAEWVHENPLGPTSVYVKDINDPVAHITNVLIGKFMIVDHTGLEEVVYDSDKVTPFIRPTNGARSLCGKVVTPVFPSTTMFPGIGGVLWWGTSHIGPRGIYLMYRPAIAAYEDYIYDFYQYLEGKGYPKERNESSLDTIRHHARLVIRKSSGKYYVVPAHYAQRGDEECVLPNQNVQLYAIGFPWNRRVTRELIDFLRTKLLLTELLR
jgi:hypothetical protein